MIGNHRPEWARGLGLGALLMAIALSGALSKPCAAVPALMNYQGYLIDNSNLPVTGAHPMTFKLYPDSTTGSVLWSESYASVSVLAGVFNVVLGTVTPLPPAVFTGDSLWLLTTVNGVDILPRRRIVTVGYAFRSGIADSAAHVSTTVGAITGQVQYNCGGNSSAVLVYVPGRSFVAYTDASGNFLLSSLPEGTYTLHIEKLGSFIDISNVVVTAAGITNAGLITLGANLATDPANCGACGIACSPNNTTPSCASGVCNGACTSGFADCNGNKQADGCETSVLSDLNNCGACGATCSSNHTTPSCAFGQCNGACTSGFADCDGDKQANGCETDILNNPNHCGGCGVVCEGSQSCVEGVCQ